MYSDKTYQRYNNNDLPTYLKDVEDITAIIKHLQMPP